MLSFSGSVDALSALQDFIIDRTAPLPADLRDRLRDALKERSPVDAVYNAVEMIFGRDQVAGDVPPEMKDWAAGAAAMMEDQGFHQFDVDNRGSRMARMLRGQTVAAASRPKVDQRLALLVNPPPLDGDS